jgi:hypothetical protein
MRIISLVILSLLITACNGRLKERIGLETRGPNEYEVESGKLLEIPPHYNLPIPGETIPLRENRKPARNNSGINDGERALIQDLDRR